LLLITAFTYSVESRKHGKFLPRFTSSHTQFVTSLLWSAHFWEPELFGVGKTWPPPDSVKMSINLSAISAWPKKRERNNWFH